MMTGRLKAEGKIIQTEVGVGKKPGWFRKVYQTDYQRVDVNTGHRETDFNLIETGVVNGAAARTSNGAA